MIVYRNDYTQEQLNIIYAIAEKCQISFELAKIMYARGIDTEQKAIRFLNPGKHNFNDPYLLSGMADAVKRITHARDNDERILIFGDYDADGICATTVLFLALKDFGVNQVNTVIPERSQGYGLTHNLVESMLEEYQPGLVITVDCGISCKEEVAYIEDLGVDVIVTDHHELPDELPDCTIINCKIKNQAYPFDCLCGAGVAYKVGYALLGESANRYLDLVTVATIADSMVLLEENRDIVYEGINQIKYNPHPALQKLIEVCSLKEITSTNLGFSVAPRINASGRMGDARCALDLLLETDPQNQIYYCNKLNEYNVARQSECEKLLKSAKAKLTAEHKTGKVIVLSDKNWNGGLVGIVAAKLVEEYNRPVILFTENDGLYHGSARSIESVNIFKAVNYCKNLLVDFGGHAQAAGITIHGENLAKFEQLITDYIDQNYHSEVFVSRTEVDGFLNSRLTVDFAKELNLLEPFGTGNRKPIFCIKVENLNAYPIKPNSPHVSFRTEYLDMLYFNGEKDLDVLNAPAEKLVTFEPNLSYYNGRVSLKGYVRSFEYEVSENERLNLECFKCDLLSIFNDGEEAVSVDNEHIGSLVDEARRVGSGTIFVACNNENLSKYNLGGMRRDLFKPQQNSPKNALVLSLKECDGSSFNQIIYLDKPFGKVATVIGVPNYYVAKLPAFNYKNLSVQREIFTEAFKLLKYNRFYGKSSVDVALGIVSETLSKKQIIFCLEVFIELGIFYFAQGTLQFNSAVRSELTKSKIYNAVLEHLK